MVSRGTGEGGRPWRSSYSRQDVQETLQGLRDDVGVEHDQIKNEGDDVEELETELELVKQSLEGP